MVQARCNPLQHAEIEVDDIPAREHVRVEATRRERRSVCSAARSSSQRVARSGMGRSLPSTIRTSSMPGANSEIASRRSPFASVSMSNDKDPRLDS